MIINPYRFGVPASFLEDDFEDGTIDPALWSLSAANSITIDEAFGQLRLFVGNVGDYREIYTVPFDFTGKSLTADINIYADASGHQNYMYMAPTSGTPGNERILTLFTNTNTLFRYVNGGSNNDTWLGYPVSLHKMRYRHDGSNIYFETYHPSDPGDGWITRKTAASAFSLSSMRLMFGVASNVTSGSGKYFGITDLTSDVEL